MIEAGDVDWANHSNNIDNSIGAVLSGDEAFRTVTRWVESQSNWEETAVILTADHGHFFVLTDPQAFIRPSADLATAK
jgi:alkaline phosphatase